MFKFAGIVMLSMSGVLLSSAAFADHHDDYHHDRHEDGGVHFIAPEIDPSSAITAMTMLLGGLTVLRGRRAVN